MADSSKDIQLRELKDMITDLKKMIKTLQATVDAANKREEALTQERDNLKDEVALLRKKLFGSSSEKRTFDLPVYIISKPKDQLQVGDVIALERSYAKVTKIEGDKITAIGYTGAGKTVHTIKDFIFNQTMVRVVISLAGNVGGQMNPMLLLALSNKDDKNSLLPLLMMNQNGGALGMNPMLVSVYMAIYL